MQSLKVQAQAIVYCTMGLNSMKANPQNKSIRISALDSIKPASWQPHSTNITLCVCMRKKGTTNGYPGIRRHEYIEYCDYPEPSQGYPKLTRRLRQHYVNPFNKFL